MTNTSDRPITVDGVRLDTLAWNITKITRPIASRRSGDVTLPGADGAVPTLNDNLEPITFGLEMLVMGTDANGATLAAGRRDTFRANLDELVHLFGTRHRLLEVQEQVSATDTRRAFAKVVDSIVPDQNTPGANATMTVGLSIPAGTWEDLTTQDWVGTLGAASGLVQEVLTLRGATERATDTIVLVTGPVTNPRVSDANTGAYVQLNQALAAGQTWRVNVGTWASRYGAGLTPASTDLVGTDGQSSTVYGGSPNQAAFLPLTSCRLGGNRVTQVALSGTGMTAATRLSARTRRRFA